MYTDAFRDHKKTKKSCLLHKTEDNSPPPHQLIILPETYSGYLKVYMLNSQDSQGFCGFVLVFFISDQ